MGSIKLPPAAFLACASILAAGMAHGGKLIRGSKHDFKRANFEHVGGALFSYSNCTTCHNLHGAMVPENSCSMCHTPHKAKRASPLWARDNPSSSGWVVWNGQSGQALDGTQSAADLTGAELAASGSGLCLSCHISNAAGHGPTDFSDSHPIAKAVPFGAPGWQASLEAGNAAAASDVKLETRGTVGCTSCHSMHAGDANDEKLRRKGQYCLSCHDR